MPNRGMIVKWFEFCRVEHQCSVNCPYWDNNGSARECTKKLAKDVLTLLKEREGYVSIPFSWLVKFCTHIDFTEPLTDMEREAAWRQKLRQQFGINVS